MNGESRHVGGGDRWRRALRQAVPWLLAAAVGWVVVSNLGRHTLVRRGEPAPALRAVLSDGTELDLSALRGRVVVVNFWATWCPPCREEAPVLAHAHESLGDGNPLVVGLSTDEAPLDQVAEAARRLGMSYPIGMASPGDLERFGVQSLPTTYVLAPDGTVSRTMVGAVSERELKGALEEALLAHGGRDG